MQEQQSQLLSDDQVRRFIADGFIIIDSQLEPSFHSAVTKQITYALEYELPHPGDNILPRVPALSAVCEAPVVQGALRSLLGNQFIFLPHRFPHNSEPLGAINQGDAVDARSGEMPGEQADAAPRDARQITAFDSQPEMAAGSISASAWHQDSHASCGRTRWHTLRAANVFYFPHETPLHMGPTRFLAGSHFYATLHDLCAEQAVMQVIPAGSVVIAHFDLAHAGSPNNSDIGRYMMKFVALRTEHPTAATWDHQDPQWQTPNDLYTHHDLPVVWRSIWNWLRGLDRGENSAFFDGQPVSNTAADAARVEVERGTEAELVTELIQGMRSTSQQARLASLYELAAIGAPAVTALVEQLLASAGQDRHRNPSGKVLLSRSAHHLDRLFLEGQFTPEDAAVALGAMGKPALAALLELLDHPDPWMRINAVYALGEAGPAIVAAHVDRITALLDDPEPSVIRVTLDALAALGQFGGQAIARMHCFLAKDVPGWGSDAESDYRLSMLGQMRYLSAIALLAWGSNASTPPPDLVAEVEAALLETLTDSDGYPPLIACMALERADSVEGLRAAVRYLRVRAWDAAQNTRPIGAWTIAHRQATLARISALD